MNVCIVGYGAIGPVHANALNVIPNVSIYAVCDINKSRADKASEEYNCKAFYDFSDCLSDKEVDCVHICTPHYLHFEMITSALEAGKQVVCEKPVTMTKEEFNILITKYKEAPIYPIFQNRKNHCIQTLKSIISSDNTNGELISAKGILTWCRDEEYYNSDSWRGTKKYEGGGVLINQAIHTLDLMIYLLGKVKSVSASISNKSLQNVIEVEDTADAYLCFENGAKGIFYATNACGYDSSVLLELKYENAIFRYMDRRLYKDNELVCSDSDFSIGKKCWGVGHFSVFSDIYEKNNPPRLVDIKNTMDVLFGIYDCATPKQ